MTKKVFISYSHKDESHREDLEDHLSMLKRKDVISVWHDRKIKAGDDWKNKIDDNLEEADVIFFLVSPSFLASDYCFDIEVKRAMEKQAKGEAIIISILVRPCDWSDCEFSKFQAVPKDARPITKWEDKDSAWLDAVKKIKSVVTQFTPKDKILSLSDKDKNKFELSDYMSDWIEDTEIALSHRKVSKVKLSEVYVIPDVECEQENKTDILKIESAQKALISEGRFIISGEEQQGKTTLLKYYFIELLKLSRAVVYLDANSINKSNIQESVKKALNEQYVSMSYEEFINTPKKAILIDNIDEINLRNKYRNTFLESVNELFDYVVLTCHDSFSYVLGEIPPLDDFERFELLSLGNMKREEIIQKWISLGAVECIEDEELYRQCDDLKLRLNTVIKKNIVPAKPIYILMLLQMFEANTQLNLDLTSYGHCYQQLIYQSFENAKINKTDFDKYLNVLSELAWSIFEEKTELNEHQLDVFFEKYCKKYLEVDGEEVISKLTSHRILTKKGVKTGFKYPYIYYFFVGKKIAESYRNSEEVKGAIKEVIQDIHREDHANILVFITHHTKDPWILKEIRSVLSSLFEDQEVATLERQELSFMDDFVKNIPELVIEQREIQKERDQKNKRLDEIERQTEDETEPSLDILTNINKTYKGMEITGQIIRNRHASLTRDELYDLADSGVSVGLRFLKYFIQISDSAMNEIVKIIANHLNENPQLSDKEIEKYAEHAYLHLSYGVINSVIRKISASIGSKEALEIYNILETEKSTPSFSLIKQAIELQFNKSLKIENVSKTAKSLRDNPVSNRILKEMIIQHIYMFPVEYKEKQQLANLLKISLKGQRLMDMRKRGKG